MSRLRRMIEGADAGGGRTDAKSPTSGAGAADVAGEAREQIRGSSLLLSGRGLALVLKLLTQLLMVRYLSTADYGAWAYALAAVALLGGFSSLSLHRAVSRFASIYHQRREYDRFFGTLLLVAGVILSTGIIFAGALHLFSGPIGRLLGQDELPLALLSVLVLLVPLEALDQLLIAIFATLGRAGAIFFRKYLLGPVLQLSAVLALVLSGGAVPFLARAYLAATAIGAAVNAVLLLRLLREEGLLAHFRLRSVRVPIREMFGFSLPLVTSDVQVVLIESFGVLLLGRVAGTEEVALLRVVVPLAMLGQVVTRSFTVMYVPIASRLFARDDARGLRELYWRTSLWVAVLSFPFFAATFTAATPLTVLLYGARYEASGSILAVLALGVYVKTSLGISGATLKVLGRVRNLVAVNLVTGGTSVLLNVMLVPPFGARGAAVAMTGALILDGCLKQASASRATGLNLLRGHHARPWAAIGAVTAGLAALHALDAGHPALLWTLAAAASIAVLASTRSVLAIDAIFPELARVPVLRRVFR